MANRINIVLSYLNKILDRPGIEVRLHDTPLYNSIYRSDTTMLVNPHTYGSGAPFNPVMHLQQVPGGPRLRPLPAKLPTCVGRG